MKSCPSHGTINTMDGELLLPPAYEAGDDKGRVFGGHLNRALVSATCEMIITVIDGTVDRAFSEEVELNLFRFLAAFVSFCLSAPLCPHPFHSGSDRSGGAYGFAVSAADTLRAVGRLPHPDVHFAHLLAGAALDTGFFLLSGTDRERNWIKESVNGSQRAHIFAEGPVVFHGQDNCQEQAETPSS